MNARSLSLIASVVALSGCSSAPLLPNFNTSLPAPHNEVSADSLHRDVGDIVTRFSSMNDACNALSTKHVAHEYSQVVEEYSIDWCGTQEQSNRLISLLVVACDKASGKVSGEWCYNPTTHDPLFKFSNRKDYPNDSDPHYIHWHIDLATPKVDTASFEWLTYARTQDFLTHEQRAYQPAIKARLAKLEVERKFDEKIETLRTQIRTHYANRRQLQGKYGVLACKRDDRYATLDGEFVGRVLSTHDHQVQIQLVEFRGLAGAPASFEKGEVVLEDYRFWELCQ